MADQTTTRSTPSQDTVSQDTVSQDTVSASRPRRSPRLRAFALTLLVALLLASGLSAIQTQPAAATHTTNVSGCFVWPSGSAAGSLPVTLQRWTGSAWVNHRSGTLSSGGCATFTGVPGHKYYRMSVYKYAEAYNAYHYCWTGATHWSETGYGLASGTSLRLGSWYVNTGYINSPRCY